MTELNLFYLNKSMNHMMLVFMSCLNKFLYFLTLLTLCTSVWALTPVFNTERELISYIEDVRQNSSADPFELEESMNSLIKTSRDAQWKKAELFASSLLLEMILEQEDINAVIPLYEKLLPLATQMNEQTIVTRLMVVELRIRIATDDSNNIEALYKSLKQRAEATLDPLIQGEIYQAIGFSYFTFMNYSGAIQSYKLAYEAYEKGGSQSGQAGLLHSLASTYTEIGDFDSAQELYEKALAFLSKENDRFSESIILYSSAIVHIKVGELALAEEKLNKALAIGNEINDDIGVAWVQASLANIALKNEHWDKAINLSELANIKFEQAGHTRAQFNNLLTQVRAYLGIEKIELADAILGSLRALITADTSKELKIEYNALFAEVAFKKANYKQAYLSLEENFEWLSELAKSDQAREVQRYKVEFDTQLQENINQVLLKENELKELKIISQQQQEMVWLIVIVLSFVILFIVLILLFIQTQNRNRFRKLAMRDHLTNSPNRRAILKYAKTCLDDAMRTDDDFSIAIVDLDFFKKLNDQFGHDIGDQVLKDFADACVDTLRKQDGFGRYGGEEWLFVFSNTRHSEIEGVFYRLRNSLQQKTSKIAPELLVTFSMGVSQYAKKTDDTLQHLIKRADDKLYLAKERGRDQVII